MGANIISIIDYLIPRAVYHESIKDDLQDTISDKQYRKRLIQRWSFNHSRIMEFGLAEAIKSRWIEPLRHVNICGNSVYEQKYKIGVEFRIIFVFKGDTPVYLTAFKKNARYSYDDEIERATNRYKDLVSKGVI